MTPDYGQGANAAMVDGLVLATHLARSAMDAEAIASGARQYEAIRRPFVDRTQSDAWRTSRMARVRSPAGRWARNTLVRLVSRLSAVRARQLRRIAGDNPHEAGYL